jgi:hypothetical protein
MELVMQEWQEVVKEMCLQVLSPHSWDKVLNRWKHLVWLLGYVVDPLSWLLLEIWSLLNPSCLAMLFAILE